MKNEIGLYLIILMIVILIQCANIYSEQRNDVTPAPTLENWYEPSNPTSELCKSDTEKYLQNPENKIEEKPLIESEFILKSSEETTLESNLKSSYNERILKINDTSRNLYNPNIKQKQRLKVKNMVTINDWKLIFFTNKRSSNKCFINDNEANNMNINLSQDEITKGVNGSEKNDTKPEPENIGPHVDILESFEEWKKNQLQEAKDKKVEVSSESVEARSSMKSRKLQVNYASQDCGAKILDHNKEAKHVSAILDENKDLYMLNPCSNNIWFVIELCEPIQLQTIHLSNLELFSSSPNEFIVSVSERYPAREWRVLGNFNAENKRNLQIFSIDNRDQLFAKYVRFQMVSHFGNEHFCPLTMVRVFGISMVEVYDSEEQEKDNGLPNEDEHLNDKISKSSEEDGAFNTVINIVKSAIGIEKNKNNGQKTETNITPNPIIPDDEDEVDPNWESPVQLLDSLNISDPLVVVVKTGNGEDVESEKTSKQSFYKIPLCAPAFLKHITPVAKSLNAHICLFLEFVCKISLSSCFVHYPFNQSAYNITNNESLIENKNISLKTLNKGNITDTDSMRQVITDSSSLQDTLNVQNKQENNDQSITKEKNTVKMSNESILKKKEKMLEVDKIQNSNAKNIEDKSNSDVSNNLQAKTIPDSPESEIKVDSVDPNLKVDKTGNHLNDNSEDNNVKTREIELNVVINDKNSVLDSLVANENKTKNNNENQTSSPPVAKNHSSETIVINPGSNQKESVFMRLSNRIRVLEQNMSLSSTYLENLSQKYKKQVDEMQKAFNRTIAKVIETSKTADKNDQRQTELINFAQNEIKLLSSQLAMLAQSGELLNRQLIERHMLLIILEIVVFITILTVFLRRKSLRVKENIRNTEETLQKLEALLQQTQNLKDNIHDKIPSNGANNIYLCNGTGTTSTIKNSLKKHKKKTLKRNKENNPSYLDKNAKNFKEKCSSNPETIFSNGGILKDIQRDDFNNTNKSVLIDSQSQSWVPRADQQKSRK